MSIQQIKSLVQFTRASSLVWQAMTIPIPNGIVTFSVDDGAFKLGNGVSLYTDLPTLFTYEDLLSAQGGVSNLFKSLVVGDDGKIAVVYFDTLLGKIKYAPSANSLTDILTQISALEANDASQTAVISTLLSLALSIDVGINTAPDGSIVVINSGRFSNSGTTVAGLSAQVAAGAPYIPGSRLEDPVIYVDQNKQLKADKYALLDGNTYYIEVIGYNNDIITPIYNVACANTNVVITNVAGPLFSVRFNNITGAGKIDTPVVLVVSVDDGTGNRLVKKAITCTVQFNRIIAATYGGSGSEFFYAIAADKNDNVIAVGKSSTTVFGGYDALVVKYDSSLNVLVSKRYGGSGTDYFQDVIVDSDNNIICCGSTTSEGTGNYGGLVVKFDSDLNILVRKHYGGAYDEEFRGVAVDKQDNIICCGYSWSEITPSADAIVVKFDSNLNIINRKTYYGSAQDHIERVIADSSNNIICVGTTSSEGAGSNDALIIKFDSSLNILARKRYGGSGDETFLDVAIDSSDNIICVGSFTTGSSGVRDGFIIKFDTNLNKLAGKSYGGTISDRLYGVTVDSSDNIIAAGYIDTNAVVVKFDNNLNVISSKLYSGANTEYAYGVVVNNTGSIMIVGTTTTEGDGSDEAFILKIPSNIPSGSFVGSVLTGLTLSDSVDIAVAENNLTLANSNLTLTGGTVTSGVSTLSLVVDTLMVEKDFLN
jgi:hypothetical protein